jgi:NitT/TauT family transport system substrate-binding protein
MDTASPSDVPKRDQRKALPPRLWLAGIMIVLVVAVAGFFAVSRRQPAPAEPTEALTIATNMAYQGSGLVIIAQEKGYFAAEGLRVVLKPHTSGKAALDAVLTHKAEIATAGDTPIMFAAIAGERVALLATLFVARKDQGIVGRRDRGMVSLGDLQGKRVGLMRGTSSDFVLDTLLVAHKLLASDITIVPLQPEEFVQALLDGQVEAISMWQPYVSIAQRALGDRAITFYAENLYVTTLNLVSRHDLVTSRPATIVKCLRALVRAEGFIRERPAEARALIAAATKIDRALLEELLSTSTYAITLDQALVTSLEEQSRWALKYKLTSGTQMPNYLTVLYLDGLQAVKPQAITVIR